jgi:pyruvate dehydrogenase E2 component (dihydrolipoamide acetyltransferase)
MTTELVMPQMGESLSEGTITKWYKKPGDAVRRDEPLFEITTDKVDTDVPSPIAGVLETILIGEGETVAVGTVVGVVAERAGRVASSTSTGSPEKSSDPSSAAQSSPRRGPRESEHPSPGSLRPPLSELRRDPDEALAKSGREPTSPQRGERVTEHPSPGSLRELTSPQRGEVKTEGHFRSAHEPMTFDRRKPRVSAPAAPPAASDRRAHLSPAVLSLAATHQIPVEELTSIEGTGRRGRITKKDVERYIASGRRSRRVHEPRAVSVTTASMPSPPAQYLYQPEPTDQLVPMDRMRKQIAEHMLWSQQISAQVTSFTECDMHRIVRFRDEQRARFEEREGVSLTLLPFVAEATVKALKEFPIFNASVVEDQIALKKHVHLGVAIALEAGLVAPVVRNADEMNFVGLARSIHGLSERARRLELLPSDVEGATFTITNPGMFGGLTGTPMIPQPQVAILGMGAVQKKPVVVDDAIAIRPIVVLALTFDHRIIDGATGFQFLERIRIYLEHFDLPQY